MFVPAPAAAHELGVGGTAEVAGALGCGLHGFAGSGGAADGDAGVGPKEVAPVIAPILEF